MAERLQPIIQEAHERSGSHGRITVTIATACQLPDFLRSTGELAGVNSLLRQQAVRTNDGNDNCSNHLSPPKTGMTRQNTFHILQHCE
jgi:hypothetical protein